MDRTGINIGDKFICIEDVIITGRGVLLTKGKIYKSRYKNCLTNNGKVKCTIVWSSSFDFYKHFKESI